MHGAMTLTVTMLDGRKAVLAGAQVCIYTRDFSHELYHGLIDNLPQKDIDELLSVGAIKEPA